MTGRIGTVRPKPGYMLDGAGQVVPQNVVPLRDNLVNAMSGIGTGRDVRTAGVYLARPLTQQEIVGAYSGSGLIRKIVCIPALDMVREWRDWSGLDDAQAAKIYDEEKRLAIRQKIQQAEILRRMGGGALVLGLPGDPDQPVPNSAKGALAFVHVVSRWHLNFDRLQDDATQPGHGEPAMWKLNTTDGQKSLHPSRVIPFRGDCTAALAFSSGQQADAFWGESVIAQVLDAVKDSDTARASFAALVHKARLLRIGIPGLMGIIASGGTATIQNRLAAVTVAESVHNATIYDAGDGEGNGGEEIKDATYNFAGAKDILNALWEFVSALSDIPATRLLGRAPEGMNASGDSQQADWRKKVRAMQTLELGPCLDRLDAHLVPSALGSMPATASYEYAPLDTETATERAMRWKTEAEAMRIVSDSGHVPDEAMSKGVQSWLVNEGYLPELESALEEIPDEERYGIPAEAGATKGGDPDLDLEGAGEQAPPLRRAANDAAPRPLYVRRQLQNAGDLVLWAKAEGLETTLEAKDMHVTVLFSRTAVDWMKMGESWGSDENGGLTIRAGGPRELEKFDGGAVVLRFASWSLRSRHAEMVEAGASHDFAEYSPHVTLTYDAPEAFDFSKIIPFAGELRFGPEIFEPLDEDWKSKIEER